MKKIVMILAATAFLFGSGLAVEKTKDARLPVGGAHAHKVAYIPVGGTSEVAYVPEGNMTVQSIPVGGT